MGTATVTAAANETPSGITYGLNVTGVSPFPITETRNDAAVTFPGLTYTVTDTASAAGSSYWQILAGSAGATPMCRVYKNGSNATLLFGGAQPHYLNVTGNVLYVGQSDGAGDAYMAVGRVLLGGGASGRLEPNLLQYGSGGILGWASSDPSANAATDSGITQVSAGILAIGTGAVGNTAGSLSLKNTIVNGVHATSAAAPTIASATTIAPTTSIVFVSGVTTIETITPPSPISAGGGSITIIPTGVFLTGVTGNIALASTSVVSKALTMTYDVTTTKWYPSY